MRAFGRRGLHYIVLFDHPSDSGVVDENVASIRGLEQADSAIFRGDGGIVLRLERSALENLAYLLAGVDSPGDVLRYRASYDALVCGGEELADILGLCGDGLHGGGDAIRLPAADCVHSCIWVSMERYIGRVHNPAREFA